MTVGGGTEGLLAIMKGFFKHQAHDAGFFFFWGLAVALYIMTIISGLLLVDGPKRTLPLIIVFMLQILSFSSPILGYHFTAGGRAVIGFSFMKPSDWNYFVNCIFGSHFELSWQDPNQPWGAGINLLAVAMLVLVVLYRRTPNSPSAPTPPH